MDRILIIDDDPSGAQLLATLLEMEGYQALKLEWWSDPLGELEQRRPDLVIMDVRLQDKSGFDLLAEIRSHPDPELARTPVLLMSVEDHSTRSQQAGADGFIAKPFDVPTLLDAIREIEGATHETTREDKSDL